MITQFSHLWRYWKVQELSCNQETSIMPLSYERLHETLQTWKTQRIQKRTFFNLLNSAIGTHSNSWVFLALQLIWIFNGEFLLCLLTRSSGRVNAQATPFITSGFGSPKHVWFCQVKDFQGFLQECLRNVLLFAEILEQHLTLVFEIGGQSIRLISCISSPFLKARGGMRKWIFFSQSSLSWFLVLLLTPNVPACSLSIFHSTNVHQIPLSREDWCVWYQPGGCIRNYWSSDYGKHSLS